MAKKEELKIYSYYEILNSPLSLRHKTKRLSWLFHLTGGCDCQLDVLALIMGRNFEFCHQQQKTIHDVALSLDEKHNYLVQKCGLDHDGLIQLLVDCKIVIVSLRLIAVQNKFWDLYQNKNDNKMELCLIQQRYGCLVILCHVLATSSVSAKEQFSSPNIINVLMSSIDYEKSEIILCALLTVLKSLLFRYKNKKFFVKYLQQIDGIKICRLMNKDTLSIRMMTWINKGIHDFEKSLIISLPDYIVKDILKFPSTYSNLNDYDSEYIKMYAVKWAYSSYFQCGFMVFQMISPAIVGSKNFGRLLSDDPLSIEALINWAKVPAYHSDDIERISICVKTLGYIIVDNEKLARDLIHKYNFMKYMELGVSHPNQTLAQYYIICIGSTGRCNSSTRRTFVDNKIILQGLIRACFSANRELQEITLHTIHSLVDKHTTPKIIKAGFSRKEILILHYFYDVISNLHILYRLRKDMEKYHSGLWKKGDDEKIIEEFEEISQNEGKVCEYKEKGNQFYNEGNYKKAIEFYTKAINMCSPTSNHHIMHAKKSSLIIEIHKSKNVKGEWYSIPPTLYSNRAQCYLQQNQYKEAVQDCNYAIVFCDAEYSEAKKTLLKTALRRSTAFYELGNYTQALIDIGYCIIEDSKNTTYKTHFEKVFSKYCNVVGDEDLIRRCTVCWEGEGEKLKRCANCKERYCSKKCQMTAWERGHKDFCPNDN